jgi:SAM-dependent methyltransferase
MFHSLRAILSEKFVYRYHRLFKKVKCLAPAPLRTISPATRTNLDFLRKVRRDIEGITLSAPRKGHANEVTKGLPSLTQQAGWNIKQQGIYNFINEQAPRSVLDIGSNTGWYAQLAARMGSQVVALDKDPQRVARLYEEAKGESLSILPLIMDFTKPTPARGPAQHWSIAATERLQCDLVLALGLLHRLVRDLYFPQIVEGLASFTKRWLIVEFISCEDSALRNKWWSVRLAWYTLDNFVDALRQRFRQVTMLPSTCESRMLLVCEK